MYFSILAPVCICPMKTPPFFSQVIDEKERDHYFISIFQQSVVHSLSTKSGILSCTCSLRAEFANTALATEAMHPPASTGATVCRSQVYGSDRDGDEIDIWNIMVKCCYLLKVSYAVGVPEPIFVVHCLVLSL